MERNVKPAIAKFLYAARDIRSRQHRFVGKAADPRRIPFTEPPQLQRGTLKLVHGLLQCFLQFVGIHLSAIGQCDQRAGRIEGGPHQLLNVGKIPLHVIHCHNSPLFFPAGR